MLKYLLVVLLLVGSTALAETQRFGAVDVERLEYLFEDDATELDLTANYGTDEHQVVVNLEAEADASDTHTQTQLLYSRPLSAYFDLRLGLEVANSDIGSRSGAVVGIEGQMPYRIHVETYLKLDEDGEFAATGEFERDFLLTQRIGVQPRAELHLGDSSALALELRARYEFTRKFAPYIGLSWRKAYGDAADVLRANGIDTDSTSAVAGFSFWF